MAKNTRTKDKGKTQLPTPPRVAAVAVASGGSVKACERQDNPKASIKGEYYFVVKIVPVNADEPMTPQFVGTIHRANSAEARAAGTLDVAVGSTTLTSNQAFRFVVQDLNSALDSFADAQCAIESREGKGWLSNATDYIVLKATISP